jgi:hypothetical protein
VSYLLFFHAATHHYNCMHILNVFDRIFGLTFFFTITKFNFLVVSMFDCCSCSLLASGVVVTNLDVVVAGR